MAENKNVQSDSERRITKIALRVSLIVLAALIAMSIVVMRTDERVRASGDMAARLTLRDPVSSAQVDLWYVDLASKSGLSLEQSGQTIMCFRDVAIESEPELRGDAANALISSLVVKLPQFADAHAKKPIVAALDLADGLRKANRRGDQFCEGLRDLIDGSTP